MPETLLSPSDILLFGRVVEDLRIVAPGAAAGGGGKDARPEAGDRVADPRHGPFAQARKGAAGQLERQLCSDGANFARIYGFSHEGFYHALPRPALFLVHGPGLPAAGAMADISPQCPADEGPDAMQGAGGPHGISLPGDLMVWSYDKGDYTIRMDVQSGMFEQLLLGGQPGPGGPDAHGMSVRGMSAPGMSVRGGKKD